MQGAANGLKSNMRQLGIKRIRQQGTRECETCGEEVPVMIRTDKHGEEHQESICLSCETKKTKSRFPDKQSLKRTKAKGFSLKYEKIPKNLQGKVFQDFLSENDSEENMLNTVQEYVNHFGKTNYQSLLLKGPSGLGKSHLAHVAGKELRDKGYGTMFIRSDDFLSLIKSTFDNPNLSEKTIFEMIEEIDLLIFDEIGAEYSNNRDGYESWASEKILKVTDLRENLPTIYTTNYSAPDFESKYGKIQGGRIASRMMSGAKRVLVDGRDRRVELF